MATHSFPKDNRILNRSDFVNLNRSGQRLYTKHFTIIFKRNGLGRTRLGITVSKRTGKAVKRNTIKRLIREFYRTSMPLFPQGYDIVIVAKKDVSRFGFHRIKDELGKVICNKTFHAEA